MRIPCTLHCEFVPLMQNNRVQMKKITLISISMVILLTLSSHSPIGNIHGISGWYDQDSITTRQDTSVAIHDTLSEIEIKAKKGLAVEEAIKKSLNNGLVQPRQKGISDLIGPKANDYIMHPFAWLERRKEKNLKRAKENVKKLEAAKTYEDELTEAINRQLREDSIANARKQQKTNR